MKAVAAVTTDVEHPLSSLDQFIRSDGPSCKTRLENGNTFFLRAVFCHNNLHAFGVLSEGRNLKTTE